MDLGLIQAYLLYFFYRRTIEKHGMTLKLATDGCVDTEHRVTFLEHVQVKISLTYSRRGDLQLHLLSPSETPSTLLPRRKDDYQPGRLDSWHFLSVFYWGERPNGTWTLILENVGSELNAGNVMEVSLIIIIIIIIRRNMSIRFTR